MNSRPVFRPRHFALFVLLAIVAAVFHAPSSGEAAKWGRFVRVKVKEANIRSGPGTRNEKIWTAPRNYPYRVLGRQGKWLKVRDFEGHVEWVHASLTDQKRAVIVKVKTANIRNGPGKRYGISFTAEKGVAFRVLRQKGAWLKIRHADSDEGWIFRRIVWGK